MTLAGTQNMANALCSEILVEENLGRSRVLLSSKSNMSLPRQLGPSYRTDKIESQNVLFSKLCQYYIICHDD